MVKDNYKSYSETCNMIRHYSNMSFTVRTISVVHGLALVATWILNYGSNNFIVLFSLPVFGLLFTYLIFRFHKGYYDAATFFIHEASKMEKILFDELYRPFHYFRDFHRVKYGKTISKVFVLNAPFTLIGSLFIVIFILTVLKIKLVIR